MLSSGASEVATLFDLLQGSGSTQRILSNVQIAEISFQCNPVIVTITSRIYDTSYRLIPDVLQARNLSLRLVIESSFELSVTFSGFLLLAGTTFSVLIAEDDNSVYYLDASTNQISLQPLLSSFSASVVPAQLQPIAGSLPFLNFAI